jgi:tellurite resistance protein TerC
MGMFSSLLITRVPEFMAKGPSKFSSPQAPMSLQRAVGWSLFWIGLALATGVVIAFISPRGWEVALEYYAGYAIEKALSVDNLFVFLMLFSHFRIATENQRRILNYGIIGVLLLRGLMIFGGISLVNEFEWVLYVFGVLVIYTGFIMAFGKEKEFDPSRNTVIRLTRKLIPVTDTYHGDHFFVIKGAKRYATPLFVVLIVIELTDVMFAVDSIPAVFSVSRDPLVVYSSNILAVLGLRSLYFLLERMQQFFAHMKKGVGVVLWFVGFKMLYPLINPHHHIDIRLSLVIILGILLISVLVSLKAKPVDIPGEK